MVETDPQHHEAGMKGGHVEPTNESHPAELRRGKKMNSRLNRRHAPQAYVGYRLGPKRTWRKAGQFFPGSRMHPESIPANSETLNVTPNGTSERSNSSSALWDNRIPLQIPRVGVNQKRMRKGIVSKAKAHGKAMG